MHRFKKVGLSAVAAAVLAATLIPATGSSAADGEMRVSKNYRLGNERKVPRGDDGPGLAVKPGNPNHIVEVNADWIEEECEFNVSFDGGRTWKGGELQAPAGFSDRPCSALGHGSSAMDGSVAFGSGNNVYTTFATAMPGEANAVVVAKSTDGGRSFQPAVVARAGGPTTDEGPEHRFPKLTVVPRASGDQIFVVAHATNRSQLAPMDDVVLAVSEDGGETWTDRGRVDQADVRVIEPTQPVVGPDGALYVAWRVRGHEAKIVIAKSTDGGTTWEHFDVAPVQGAATATTQFTGSTFPRLAVDPDSGNLYIVYGQGPINGSYPGRAETADHFIHIDMDVLFVRSIDGGETWSKPEVLNDPPIGDDVTQTRHPNVSVAPNGRVDVVWHDRRHWYEACTDTHSACEEARLGDTYYAFSVDGGLTWSDNFRITDRSINNDVGFDYRFGAYWDFGPVSVPMGNNKVLFAWMDSREGSFTTDNMDIYLARLNLSAKRAMGVNKITQKGRVGMSVALSKMAYPGGAEAVLASTFATREMTKVVIAKRRDVASILAGGVLARAHLGPVLLTGGKRMPEKVEAEVARLSPTGAFLLGNLGPRVEASVLAAGVPAESVVRIGGSALDQAAAIAQSLDRRTEEAKQTNVPAFDAAIVVNPDHKTASAASVLAANRRLPVLFSGKGSVPQETLDALSALAIDKTIVIGGTDAISDAAAAQLPSPQRLGSNRLYLTSRAVVQESRARGLPLNVVFVADGARPVDGALYGAAGARIGGLLLLAPGGDVRPAKKSINRLGLRRHVDHLVIHAI